MEIALYTDGLLAIVGIKSADGAVDLQSYDANLLFQDPDLLSERLFNILKRRFNVDENSGIQKIIFGIPGYINNSIGQIEVSRNLDELTNVKSYRGFSFKNHFKKYVAENNIYVGNDAVVIGLGVNAVREFFKPALFISINKGVGVSIIDPFGEIHPTELGSWFILSRGKAVTFLISRDKINDLLHSGSNDIYSDYTSAFITVIEHFRGNANKFLNIATKKATVLVLAIYNKLSSANKHHANMLLKVPSDRIFIWSAIEEYLDKKMIADAGLSDILYFPRDEEEKLKIPVLGCFEFPKYLEIEKHKIEYIEYYSRDERKYTFTSFEEFQKHWKEVKSFANPENEYRINYKNGIEKSIIMKDLNYDFELEEYKF